MVSVSTWGRVLTCSALLMNRALMRRPLHQTSMESRLQRCIPMARVREAVIRHLQQVFKLERHHLYTRHPLIRRKVLSHVYAPSPG